MGVTVCVLLCTYVRQCVCMCDNQQTHTTYSVQYFTTVQYHTTLTTTCVTANSAAASVRSGRQMWGLGNVPFTIPLMSRAGVVMPAATQPLSPLAARGLCTAPTGQ